MISVATSLLRSSYHEAGHSIVCFSTPGAALRIARAATDGRGTSQLLNAKELDPLAAATIAVAGRVAESVFLGVEEDIPENDGFLLQHARSTGALSERDLAMVRQGCVELLLSRAEAVVRIAGLLRANADVDCAASALRAVSNVADWEPRL